MLRLLHCSNLAYRQVPIHWQRFCFMTTGTHGSVIAYFVARYSYSVLFCLKSTDLSSCRDLSRLWLRTGSIKIKMEIGGSVQISSSIRPLSRTHCISGKCKKYFIFNSSTFDPWWDVQDQMLCGALAVTSKRGTGGSGRFIGCFGAARQALKATHPGTSAHILYTDR